MSGADLVAPMAVRQLHDVACSLLHPGDRPRRVRVELLAESGRSCCIRVRIDYAGPAEGGDAAPALASKANHLWCSTNLCCSHKTCRVVPVGGRPPAGAGHVVTRSACQVWRRTLLGRWVQEPVGSRLYRSYFVERGPRAPADLEDHWKDRLPRRVIQDLPELGDA
jgi:hypothetical protein